MIQEKFTNSPINFQLAINKKLTFFFSFNERTIISLNFTYQTKDITMLGKDPMAMARRKRRLLI